MTNNNHDESFKKILENKELADEMEKINPNPGITSKMVGHLLSSWLSRDTTRKVILKISQNEKTNHPITNSYL